MTFPVDDSGNNDHPAWNEYLEKFPEDARDTAREVFTEWDKGVQQRFQGLHSEVEPYRQLIDEYEPEALNNGVALLQQLSEDPRRIYDLLKANYGFTDEQGTTGAPQQQSQQQQRQPDYSSIPPEFMTEFQNSQELLRNLAEVVVGQNQRTTDDQELEDFAGYLNALEQQYGDFDYPYVLAQVAAGMDPEDAVQAYHQLVPSQAIDNSPLVLGSGGGLPSNNVDFAKLSNTQTKDTITKLLEQANRT